MNKLNLLLLALLFTTFSLLGQEQKEVKPKNVLIGINIGPNYNSLRGGSFAEKYDSHFNYFTGLSLEYKIKENLSILTNVNYEIKSFDTEYRTMVGFITDFYIVDFEDETEFQYLNIPLMFRFYFGFEYEFFVNGGVFYNYLLDVQNQMINKEDGEDFSDFDFNDFFEQNDLGFSLGIGMNFKINKSNFLFVELRDDLGVKNIGAINSGSISPTRTNTIKLIVNWSLNI